MAHRRRIDSPPFPARPEFAILPAQRKEGDVGRIDRFVDDDGDWAEGDGEEWKGGRREGPVPGESSPPPEHGGVDPPSEEGVSAPGWRVRAASPEVAAENGLNRLRMYLEMNFPPELRGEADDPHPLQRVYRADRRGGRITIKAVFRSLPGRKPKVEFSEPLVRLTATGGRLFDLELAGSGGMNGWGLMEEDLALREVFHRLRAFAFFLDC